MNKRNFNVVGNNETDNQEFAKGIAFVKSRRAELNVVQMVENMRDQAMPNGVIINDAYCDRSMTIFNRGKDKTQWFFAERC